MCIRDSNIAAIDYNMSGKFISIKTPDFDSSKHFELLKVEVAELHNKGKLSTLKRYFRDLTEMIVETRDFKFNEYILKNTGYQIDIFEAFNKRIEKIITKGKITTNNQYYDLMNLVNQLCEMENIDEDRITALNKLLADFETK